MHNFMIWLFKKRTEPFEIAFLNFFHILYLLIILGCAIGLAYYLKSHKEKTRPTLRALSYVITALYVSDFFLQPFVSSDFTMNIDKLPFHICTVLCPIIAFAEFNPKFAKIKEPVAILAIAAPLMYLVYPGNAIGEISPICYKILQTFIYHGCVFTWGLNTLSSGEFVPTIKNWYKSLIAIGCIAAWATFGNLAYNTSYTGNDPCDWHYDWLFLTGSSFGMSPILMPFLSIAAIFGTAMAIYGIYYAYIALDAKRTAKKAIKETANV